MVTEYRRHRLRCRGCGATTCGDLPAGVAGQDGPRLRAACALLTGAFRLSKAKAARLLGDLFGVPLSAAQVSATEAAVGDQLRPVADGLLAAARRHPANVDETSMGKGRWLWAMVTAAATVFRIVSGRTRDELTRLLGPDYWRVLTSDRHALYMHLPDDRHQLCWSHTIRTQSPTGRARHLIRHVGPVLAVVGIARRNRGDRLRLQVAERDDVPHLHLVLSHDDALEQ